MIFPIGRYAGATGDGAHEVCRSGQVQRLDALPFAAWGLAHGPVDPVLAAAVPWTRSELLRYAGMAGLAEPEGLLAGLAGRGLVAEAPGEGAEAIAFARAHRVVPVAVGLGSDAEQPGQFTIGLFDQGLVQVDEARYEVWSWSAVYDTLWQVCQARAGASEQADAQQLLGHFLAGVHLLLSASVLWLDVAA